MSSRKTLFIFAIITIFATVLIACRQNTSAGSDKETSRQVLKSNASKNEPPSLDPSLDGPVQISYSDIYKDGSTYWSSVELSSLTNLPPLPTDYEGINKLAYKLDTDAVVSGYNTTTFRVSSIRDPAMFNKLAILHIEFDELSPYSWTWVDNTVLPHRRMAEYFAGVSQGRVDKASPDFASKSISAIHTYLGVFVLAQYNSNSLQRNQPFTRMETSTIGSPARVLIGDNVTYTITVKNKGPLPAADVNLKNELDIDIDFVSATPTQGTCKESDQSDGRTICHLGALEAGANATITIVGKIRNNTAMDTGPRKRVNSTYIVYKEHPTDMVNVFNVISYEILTTTIPRSK